MENTHEFVESIQAMQRKNAENKKRQGKGHPEQRLPNKKH